MDITINPNRIELDEAYMQMAEVWAQRSKANRLQVGALIVKDRQIISDGYNGMPSGVADDTCEEWYFDGNRDREPGYTGELRTKQEVLHAESNALMKIAENGGVGAQGATLYTTYSPCPECAKLIKQAKIARVVYRHAYRLPDGILMLRKLGVRVDHLPYGDEPELPASAPRIESPQALRTGALDDMDWPVHPKPTIPSRGEDPQVSRLLREVAQQRAPQPAPKPAPPPPPPQSTMSDDEEVQRLLREFEAHQAAQAKAAPAVAPNGNPVAPPEAPYRSSFL